MKQKLLLVKSYAFTSELFGDQLSIIVQLYCNFGYATGMCPFWLSKDRKSNKFRITNFRLQKVFCMITTVILLLYHVGILRADWRMLSAKKKHPYLGFHGGFGICRFLIILLTLKIGWFESHRFLNLINFLANTKNDLPSIPIRTVLQMKALLLSVAFVMIAGVLGHEIMLANQYSTPTYMLQNYYTGLQYFYLDNTHLGKYSNETNFFNDQTQPTHRIFLTWIFLMARVHW